MFSVFIILVILSEYGIKSDAAGPITFGGNKSLEECTTAVELQSNNTPDEVAKAGYPLETHYVLTEDGYLLTMHRLPNEKGKAVIVQHGICSSSLDWVILGKDKSLAFLLHDQGYDVWLTNSRGSPYSRCHVTYSDSEPQFWDFSFHEMGIFDVPAWTKYITDLKQDDLIYIGYSMGTTMFYITGSERPETLSKIKAAFHLAPISYVGNIRIQVKVAVPLLPVLDNGARAIGIRTILSQTPVWKFLINHVFSKTKLTQALFANALFIFLGFDNQKFNYPLFSTLFNNFPAGASAKSVAHYAQHLHSGRFRQYDYGRHDNLKRYNSTEPPDYSFSTMKIPVGMFWSGNDFFADQKGIERMFSEMPNKMFMQEISYKKFNHIDYIWADDVAQILYDDLISAIGQYR